MCTKCDFKSILARIKYGDCSKLLVSVLVMTRRAHAHILIIIGTVRIFQGGGKGGQIISSDGLLCSIYINYAERKIYLSLYVFLCQILNIYLFHNFYKNIVWPLFCWIWLKYLTFFWINLFMFFFSIYIYYLNMLNSAIKFPTICLYCHVTNLAAL